MGNRKSEQRKASKKVEKRKSYVKGRNLRRNSKKSKVVEMEVGPIAPPSVPSYSVRIPDEHVGSLQECEDRISEAKTMKALKDMAKDLGVKGYSTAKKEDRGALEDAIREHFGQSVGGKIFNEKIGDMTPEDMEVMSGAAEEGENSMAVSRSVDLKDNSLSNDQIQELQDEIGKAIDEANKPKIVRACDVIPRWLDALEQQEWDQDAYSEFSSETDPEQGDDLKYGDFIGVLRIAEEADPLWASDQVATLLNRLFKALNKCAPAGFYFGIAVEDKGEGDWGFWKNSFKPVEEGANDGDLGPGVLEIDIEEVDSVETDVVIDVEIGQQGAGE